MSQSAGWRDAGDWFLPEVGVIAQAMVLGGKLEPMASNLGFARAEAGVGIAETFEDFRCGFAALDLEVDVSALQALAEGWATGLVDPPGAYCVEPGTGLSTISHLEKILLDNCLSDDSAENTILAVIRLPDKAELWAAPGVWSLQANLGQICLSTFEETKAVVAYDHRILYFLLPNTAENFVRLHYCQLVIEDIHPGLKDQTRLECEATPLEQKTVGTFLQNLV
ncbi:hypothetical protein FHU41_000895 [Psychromicrobium silvestre]|uniref:Uncharacterized protein n=1 Tax=Psychromicrobium silvestre TaxID=1645614 RepID=A0A7Y9LSA3_9MICC|nr:hypothetical protein [Psychromicrobium silvestre]NYE94674.1 hypothetical protein [Psychromicrobium silvestre]